MQTCNVSKTNITQQVTFHAACIGIVLPHKQHKHSLMEYPRNDMVLHGQQSEILISKASRFGLSQAFSQISVLAERPLFKEKLFYFICFLVNCSLEQTLQHILDTHFSNPVQEPSLSYCLLEKLGTKSQCSNRVNIEGNNF